MENENRILEALGGLKVSIDVITTDIAQIKIKQDIHAQELNKLSTSLEIYKTHSAVCSKEFTDINSKLARDYNALNKLEADSQEIKTIAKYKSDSVGKLKGFLAIVATVVGILISVNQLLGIKQKVTFNPVNAVYATAVDSILVKDTSYLGIKVNPMLKVSYVDSTKFSGNKSNLP